jgi:hypothetical protein
VPPRNVGQLGGTLGNVFRGALEQVLHHARRAVARARRPAGRISALAFPKLGHSHHSSAGFGVSGAGEAAAKKRLRLGSPGAGAPRTQGAFGVPRLRAMKNPARFPGPGLGTLLKDIFLYLSPVSTSRSHKLHRGQKCTTLRLYSASRISRLRNAMILLHERSC